jgi:hypothetical protein
MLLDSKPQKRRERKGEKEDRRHAHFSKTETDKSRYENQKGGENETRERDTTKLGDIDGVGDDKGRWGREGMRRGERRNVQSKYL